MSSVPEISIIVAFYNVEEFARKCIASLLNQTVDDYEIVCIDDGSTDSTRKILDDASKVDERIKVFHYENAGLSEARNRGIKKARGKLVSFVDGDDVVSPYYLELLTRCMWESGASFVKGSSFNGTSDEVAGHHWSNELFFKKYSASDSIGLLLENKITESAWGCLAKKDLYERTVFPAGKKYEDLYTIAAYIYDAGCVAVLSTQIYGYVCRSGSIVNASKTDIQQAYDYLDAIASLEQSVISNDQEMWDVLIWRKALAYTRCHEVLKKTGDDTIAAVEDKALRNFIKQHSRILLFDIRKYSVSLPQTLRFILYSRVPRLYDLLLLLIKRQARRHDR